MRVTATRCHGNSSSQCGSASSTSSTTSVMRSSCFSAAALVLYLPRQRRDRRSEAHARRDDAARVGEPEGAGRGGGRRRRGGARRRGRCRALPARQAERVRHREPEDQLRRIGLRRDLRRVDEPVERVALLQRHVRGRRADRDPAALHVRQDRPRAQRGEGRSRRRGGARRRGRRATSPSTRRARTGASRSRASSPASSTTASTRSRARCWTSFEQSKTSTIVDRQRVAVLLAEAKSQRADVAQQERAALAGLRAITGIADADLDDDLVEPVSAELPSERTSSPLPATIARRRSRHVTARSPRTSWPTTSTRTCSPTSRWSAASSLRTRTASRSPRSAFANNPYNRLGAGIVLGLQWTIEPWNVLSAHGPGEGGGAQGARDVGSRTHRRALRPRDRARRGDRSARQAGSPRRGAKSGKDVVGSGAAGTIDRCRRTA